MLLLDANAWGRGLVEEDAACCGKCEADHLVHIAKQVRGMYAVRVKGRIGQEMEETLEARGIKYRPRDGTDQD